MITWFNAPNEGLSPGGQLTLKTLTATENKTYQEDGTAYTSVTVNVEGGGGSSDFSTAEVTVTNNNASAVQYMTTNISNNALTPDSIIEGNTSGTVIVVLYKGQSDLGLLLINGVPIESPTLTGDISLDEFSDVIVTGDGTITIS